jgi:hypothetical protein
MLSCLFGSNASLLLNHVNPVDDPSPPKSSLRRRINSEEPINVVYEGQIVGEYYADLWVNERVLVELKAALVLEKVHEVQLVNYLTATGVNDGLLINFGPSVQVKRKFREYKPKTPLLNAILPTRSI